MLKDLTALAEATLGGSICILLLLALGPILAKKFSPKWRYWAWLVLAVVLVTYPGFQPVWENLFPAPVQLSVPQVVTDNAYDRINGQAQDWQRVQEAGSGGGGGASRTILGGEQEWSRHYVSYENESGEEVLIEDNDFLRKVTVGDQVTYTVHWTGVAMGAYYVVLILSFVLVVVRYRRSRKRLLLWSTPADETDQAALAAARQRVDCNREAALYRCPKLHAPMLMGFSQPVVFLPETLPVGSLEAALDHELTHLKRKDTGYMLFLTLARCFHWFNPLVWLMVRAARRDMELCCDYDLLEHRDEEARRAYGRAILDQMTGREPGFSGLTTGFSGSKREVFARFRAMMDLTPKKKGRAVLALAVAAVMLSGSLVACQEAEFPPEEPQMGTSEAALIRYAWVESIDREGKTVTYIPMTQEQWDNREDFWEEMGDLERETLPLTQDAGIYHTYDGKRYPLNPTAQIYTLNMSQAGLPGELAQADTGPNAGKVIGIMLDTPSKLDLAAAYLDFTGYCGAVYAAGQGGARLLHGRAAVSLDPCDQWGQDSDHAQYTLPLAEEFATTEEIRSFLTGTSSANYPALFQFTVVDGEVTTAVGIEHIDTNMGGELTLLPGDAAGELSRAAERYNELFPDSGLTASLQEENGTPELLLENAEAGIQIRIGSPPAKGEPYPAAVTGPGSTFSFDMPVTPVDLYGAADGQASLDVLDLTGDGSPELVYIWGRGGSGVWEDQCRVFDLSTGAAYPVNVDLDLLASQVEAELVEAREDVLVYRVAGARITGLSTLERRSPDQEPGETLVLGDYTSIQLLEDGTLELAVSIGVQGDAMYYAGNYLGFLVTQLEFSPSLRAFTTLPANGITLNPPEAAS